jgi:hypothetical protein
MCPSLNRIMRHTGLAHRTVIDVLKRLEKQGFIEVISAKATDTQRFGFANRYSIHWDRIQEAPPEDTRTATTRLRQELAEAQRALWNNSHPDHGRESATDSADRVSESDGPSAGAALGTADLVREPHYLPSTTRALGDGPDLVHLAPRPSAADDPDLVREPHPNKKLKKETEEEHIPAKGEPSQRTPSQRIKKPKAKKPKPPPDPRHKPFWEDWESYFKTKNKCPAPQDDQEHWHLGHFLKKNSTIKQEEWRHLLNNRAHSPVNHALSLSQWISLALSWRNGPADDRGHTITGGKLNGKSIAESKQQAINAAFDWDSADDAPGVDQGRATPTRDPDGSDGHQGARGADYRRTG